MKKSPLVPHKINQSLLHVIENKLFTIGPDDGKLARYIFSQAKELGVSRLRKIASSSGDFDGLSVAIFGSESEGGAHRA